MVLQEPDRSPRQSLVDALRREVLHNGHARCELSHAETIYFGLTYEKEETFDITQSKKSVKGNQKFRLLIFSKETFEKQFAAQDDDPNRWENQSMQDLRKASSAMAHDRGDASDDNSEDLLEKSIAELKELPTQKGLSEEDLEGNKRRKQTWIDAIQAAGSGEADDEEEKAKRIDWLANGKSKLHWEFCDIYSQPCNTHSRSAAMSAKADVAMTSMILI